jgi:hypothetical protein
MLAEYDEAGNFVQSIARGLGPLAIHLFEQVKAPRAQSELQLAPPYTTSASSFSPGHFHF